MERKWPYIWGPGQPDQTEINEQETYVFPEFERPMPAGHFSQQVRAEYSTDPADLGICEVVMTGKQFVDELDLREITMEIGEWSKQ